MFKLRSKTLDVKQNVKGQNKNPWCSSCGLFQETQSHLLQCPELVKNLHFLRGKTSKLDENFVYGSLAQQSIIVKIYSDILEIREKLQHSSKSTENLQHSACKGENLQQDMNFIQVLKTEDFSLRMRAQCTLLSVLPGGGVAA